MIKVGTVVEDLIKKDHEAIASLSRGILNLSSYARLIHKKVEAKTKKGVKLTTIIMSLSRLGQRLEGVNPLLQKVVIDGLTVKTPLAELVFEKSPIVTKQLATLEKAISPRTDEWFSFSQNTRAIIVICSESKSEKVVKHMKTKPALLLKDLSAIGLSISPNYHPKPNIAFSLLHKVAERKIPLTETITTWTEVVFVCEAKHLSELLEIFKIDYDKIS